MFEKYDDHLSLDLPYGYDAITGTNDDGTKAFSINCGTGINDNGEPTAEVKVLVRHLDGALDLSNVNFKGDFPARTGGSISEMGIGLQIQSSFSSSPGRTLTIQLLFFLVGVSCEKDSYAFIAVKTGKEAAFSENCDLIAEHLNRVLGCIKLDGKAGNFQKLTGWDVQRTLKEGKTDKDSVGQFFDSPAKTKTQKTVDSYSTKIKPELVDSEEKKRKEAEEREKVEAQRKAEVEAKKKLENDRREYNDAVKKWESECAKINEKRTSYVNDKLAEEKKQLVAAAAKRKEEAIARANAEMKKQADRKSAAESALASLGLFKFGEKKAQKAIIEDAEKKTADAQSSISAAEAAYSSGIVQADANASSKSFEFQQAAEKQYPLPIKPSKPASIIEEEKKKERERFAGMTPTQRQHQYMKDAIIEYLQDSEPMTVSDMIENIPALEGESNQVVSAILRQMVLTGDIEKEVRQRRTYFKIS